MRVVRLAGFALAASVAASSAAHAMDMAFASGSGTLRIGSKPQNFAKMSYMHLDNRRMMFSVPTLRGAVSFAGGRDSFVSGTYTLVVDAVDIAGTASPSSSTTNTHLSVTGACQLAVSPDFKVFKTLACKVRDQTGAAAEVRWTGDGSPADHPQ